MTTNRTTRRSKSTRYMVVMNGMHRPDFATREQAETFIANEQAWNEEHGPRWGFDPKAFRYWIQEVAR